MSEQNNNQSVLEHHGIDGQKWGFRRFQNSDGSLTPAGRERYGVGPARNSSTDKVKVATAKDKERAKLHQAKAKQRLEREKARLELEKLKKERHDLKRSRKAIEKQRNKEQVDDLKEVSKEKILETYNPKLLIKYRSLFTTDELRAAYNRIEIEHKLAQYIPHEKTTKEQIRDFLKNTNSTLKDITGIISSASSLFKALGLLDNGKSSDDEKGLKAAGDAAKELKEQIKNVGDTSDKNYKELMSSLTTFEKELKKSDDRKKDFEKEINLGSKTPPQYNPFTQDDSQVIDVKWKELKHAFDSIPLSVLNRNII